MFKPPHVVRDHRPYVLSQAAGLCRHLDEHDRRRWDVLGRTPSCPAHGAHIPLVVPEDTEASGPQGSPPHQPIMSQKKITVFMVRFA